MIYHKANYEYTSSLEDPFGSKSVLSVPLSVCVG